MNREQKLQAILTILVKYTYPKDQLGFVTEFQVCDEILRAIEQ
jgi:hypothetical protein